MKEQILASKNEIIIRDLYPFLVSDKRLYIVKSRKKSLKSVRTNKIIQLDKITSIRYQLGKYAILQTLFILMLFLTIAASGLLTYLFYTNKDLFENLKLGGLIAGISFFVLSVSFLLAYILSNKKIIWIEYPTNLSTIPTKVVLNHVKMKEFYELIHSIFNAIDNINAPREENLKKPNNLII